MVRQIQEILPEGLDAIKASRSWNLDSDLQSKEGDFSGNIGLYVAESSVEVNDHLYMPSSPFAVMICIQLVTLLLQIHLGKSATTCWRSGAGSYQPRLRHLWCIQRE